MTLRFLLLAVLLACAPLLIAKPKPKIVVGHRTTEYESGKLHEKYDVHVEGESETLWGDYTEYWETGKKKAEGQYEDGKRVERWEWYYESGEHQESGFYDAGVKWNGWTTWHPNGKKASDGKYANGKQQDKWIYW